MNINEKINYRASKSFLRNMNNFGLCLGFCIAKLELKKLSDGGAPLYENKRILVVARKVKRKFEINSLYQLIN